MYNLKTLPFNYRDLEPYIDTHTVGLHHNKHHKNYLKNLNNLLTKNNYNFSYPIEDLYYHLDEIKDSDKNDVLFNWGGVINHDLYWQSINPNNKEEPQGILLKSILEKYQTIGKFKNALIDMALNLKGSGYTFLVLTKKKDIDIINTLNQDSPISLGYVPLFNIDMWEHAYYLNYKNNKKEYLDNFFDIANFNYANKIMNSAKR